jgi:hypothetical protein
VSGQALESTQPPIQWVTGALSLGIKRPGREAEHSPPSSAKVNNTPSWRGIQFKKGTGTTLPLALNPEGRDHSEYLREDNITMDLREIL